MSYDDVIKLLPTTRLYQEYFLRSQDKSDYEMDNTPISVDAESNSYNPKVEPIALNKSFYEVAKAVQQNGVASIWFRCKVDNWLRWVITKLENSDEVRHSVTVIDAIFYKNTEYLVILDSAGFSHKDEKPDCIQQDGIRLMTKEAFDQGVYNQWTVISLDKSPGTSKPSLNFKSPIKYGMKNEDVLMLQKALIYLSLLDWKANTGNYLNMTRSSVKAFQIKYNVASLEEINKLNGMSVGPKTIAKLNEIFK
jgi:hypothetical protein